jgi:hypothetical protein
MICNAKLVRYFITTGALLDHVIHAVHSLR